MWCVALRASPHEDVVTVLLTHLRKLAESFLGVLVVDVVITIPARYGQQQTEALLGCCQGARFPRLKCSLLFSLATHTPDHTRRILPLPCG